MMFVPVRNRFYREIHVAPGFPGRNQNSRNTLRRNPSRIGVLPLTWLGVRHILVRTSEFPQASRLLGNPEFVTVQDRTRKRFRGFGVVGRASAHLDLLKKLESKGHGRETPVPLN